MFICLLAVCSGFVFCCSRKFWSSTCKEILSGRRRKGRSSSRRRRVGEKERMTEGEAGAETGGGEERMRNPLPAAVAAAAEGVDQNPLLVLRRLIRIRMVEEAGREGEEGERGAEDGEVGEIEAAAAVPGAQQRQPQAGSPGGGEEERKAGQQERKMMMVMKISF